MRLIFFILLIQPWLLGAHTVSLSEALTKLRHNNIELSIARMDEQIASYEVAIAKGSDLGTLDVSQSALRSNEALSVFGFKLQSREVVIERDFAPETLNNPKAHTFFQTALEYKLPLYSGGQMEARKRMMEALKTLKHLDTQKALLQKTFEVKKTFYTLSLVQNHLEQLSIIASNTDKMERLTQALYEEGYAKNVDLLEVKARKSDVARLVHHTNAQHALLLDFLSFLLNETVEAIVSVDEEVTYFLGEEKEVLERNIDIQKASKGVDVSALSVAMSEGAFLPKVGAFARYASGDNAFLNDFHDKESYTIGLHVQLNLFNGGSDKNALEKSRVELLKAKQNFFLAQKATVLQWKKMTREIENDAFAIESLKNEVALAQAIYENYAGRYAEKLVSIHEVLIKQSDEIQKRLTLKELQNRRNEKIFEREMMIHKDEL